MVCRRRRHKADLPQVYEAAQEVAPETLQAGFFPTRLQLLSDGHEDLVADIQVATKSHALSSPPVRYSGIDVEAAQG